MPRKRRQKRLQLHRKRSAPSSFRALKHIEHELKGACRTLEKHATPGINMYRFANDMKRVMLLMGEMRYLINECKIAQEKTGGKKNRKRSKRVKKF